MKRIPRRDRATERWWKEHRRCVGELASRLRREKGWTQAELSNRAGVSLHWLRTLETNQLKFNYRMMNEIRVISALGFGTYELKDFYGRVGDMVRERIGPPPWIKPTQATSSEGGTGMKFLSRREFNRHFGLSVKAIRQAKNLSRRDLAASLQATRSTSESEDVFPRTVAAFGAATTRMREDLGLTKEQLAVRSRVPLEFVCNLEAARDTNPDIYLLYCLSFGLGVPLSTFWRRAEEFLSIGEENE
jgi:transcriptional regulator with XRE-family HTH domain